MARRHGLDRRWHAIRSWLEVHAPDELARFRPGATDAAIAQAEASLERSVVFVHSAESRSLYVFAPPTSAPYAVESACVLRVGSRPPQPFSCSADRLAFQTAVFTHPTQEPRTALDQAAQAGVEGRYTY